MRRDGSIIVSGIRWGMGCTIEQRKSGGRYLGFNDDNKLK